MQGLYRFEYCKMEEPATLCEKLTGESENAESASCNILLFVCDRHVKCRLLFMKRT